MALHIDTGQWTKIWSGLNAGVSEEFFMPTNWLPKAYANAEDPSGYVYLWIGKMKTSGRWLAAIKLMFNQCEHTLFDMGKTYDHGGIASVQVEREFRRMLIEETMKEMNANHF